MLKKSGHDCDKPPAPKKFHIKNPALLSGDDFNLLMADSMHLVKGTIIILGPLPRHLEECCDDPFHKIKDEIGVEVDMLKYTNTFSSQLKRVLPLPNCNDTLYVDYRQVFGDSFCAGSLEDGVHLVESMSKNWFMHC